eukprot:CAMPEP_0197854146 /NCGR_PEP_ID=MMETSP1438-20131217/24109_1 /TAXON_ID=1461541 /ORGANISM="Pterosperma sp., Strain CCMP1384" /LENGTH=298 /DNA_ID=CAMNT_0043468793 /DNA_START=356 /DNA_END=1252 /DNA_ORIENTATION=+
MRSPTYSFRTPEVSAKVGHIRTARSKQVLMTATDPGAEELQTSESGYKVDLSSISNIGVPTVFRTNPLLEAEEWLSIKRTKTRVLFLSEGNVCRSVLAESMFTKMIKERGLEDILDCESKATRNYNLGEGAERHVVEVAADLGYEIDGDAHIARLFDDGLDPVHFDLLIAMDKFTLADVLREVSVYDTVDSSRNFACRIRRLGEFARSRVVADIDDPLYGNCQGPEEVGYMREAAIAIRDSVEGLVDYFVELNEKTTEEVNLRQMTAHWLINLAPVDWLVPPMLQKKRIKQPGDIHFD